MNLEIVWDGSHRNADRDLLCCDPIPQKREHVPLESSRSPVIERWSSTTLEVRDALTGRALTVDQVIAVTGLSYASTQNALWRLRQRGLLRNAGKAPRRKGFGRWPVKYTCGNAG